MKNIQKTHRSSKEKYVAVIQPEDFNELEKQLTVSALQNCCSEIFEKIFRKELDSLFRSEEVSTFEQIVNLSLWDMHTSISIENNVFLMSMLLYEELITKRRDKLKACKKD